MNKYLEWKQLSSDLKELKAKEMKMRKELCYEMFKGEQGQIKIKHEFEFENTTFLAVADGKIGYKLDESLVNQMFSEFSDEEKNVLNFKPVLKLAAYKQLRADALLHDAVTTVQAAPTLSVEIIKQ